MKFASNSNSIFLRTIRLQLGSSNESINEYPTFIHVRSTFDDEWFNFIIPTVEEHYFNWEKAKQVIDHEKDKGKTVSYCIHEELLDEYKVMLDSKDLYEIGTEVYMHRKALQEDIPGGQSFETISEKNFDKYLEMGRECFPEWDNYDEFSRFFHDLTKNESENQYHEYLLKENDIFVSYGSIVLSKKENLGYLHNTGTLTEYRRKGYFSSMIKFCSNIALNNGIQDLSSIVEKDEASYHGLLKLGFEVADLFHLYTTE